MLSARAPHTRIRTAGESAGSWLGVFSWLPSPRPRRPNLEAPHPRAPPLVHTFENGTKLVRCVLIQNGLCPRQHHRHIIRLVIVVANVDLAAGLEHLGQPTRIGALGDHSATTLEHTAGRSVAGRAAARTGTAITRSVTSNTRIGRRRDGVPLRLSRAMKGANPSLPLLLKRAIEFICLCMSPSARAAHPPLSGVDGGLGPGAVQHISSTSSPHDGPDRARGRAGAGRLDGLAACSGRGHCRSTGARPSRGQVAPAGSRFHALADAHRIENPRRRAARRAGDLAGTWPEVPEAISREWSDGRRRRELTCCDGDDDD